MLLDIYSQQRNTWGKLVLMRKEKKKEKKNKQSSVGNKYLGNVLVHVKSFERLLAQKGKNKI